MFNRLILLFAILIATIIIIRLLRNTPKAQFKNQCWKVGLSLVAITLILLAVTGRIHWISAVFGAMIPFVRNAIPFLIRYLPILQHYQKSRPSPPPSTGNNSRVETTVLRMVLDHDSQHLSGEVISGPFRGQNLDSLELETLQSILDYCQQYDRESVKLLASYLNHRFGSSWQSPPPPPQTHDDSMNRQLAYSILGLTAHASKQDIIRAHRKTMQKAHPDRGGSDHQAIQANQAKDLLIKQLM